MSVETWCDLVVGALIALTLYLLAMGVDKP